MTAGSEEGPGADSGPDISDGRTPEELQAEARGAELRAAIHSRIAQIAEQGAEQTRDDQVRIGVLAWAEDEMRTHRLAARECVQLSRDLYDRAARLAAV